MTRANTLPTLLSREMSIRPSVVVRVVHLAMFLYMVMILKSIVSCGRHIAPSCHHWSRTSCSGSSKVILQCPQSSDLPIWVHHRYKHHLI